MIIIIIIIIKLYINKQFKKSKFNHLKIIQIDSYVIIVIIYYHDIVKVIETLLHEYNLCVVGYAKTFNYDLL